MTAFKTKSHISNRFRHLAGLTLLLLLTVQAARSQSSTDGLTPPPLMPGAPAGSYPLSGLENINLFNGNLNFHLPLLKAGGRGDVQTTVTLKIDQRWRIEEHAICGGCGTFFYATYNWWTPRSVGYGPGLMDYREMFEGDPSCETNPNGTYKWLARLTFTAPDGTEYELRDKLTYGQPVFANTCSNPGTFGTEFVTADGTSATFIADAPIGVLWTGWLILRDGTRYHIKDGGLVEYMVDRNGNRIDFSYDPMGRVTLIKDPLNRQITFAYDVNDGAPYGICDRITYTGFQGAQRVIRISKKNMGARLRPGSGYQIRSTQYLFPTLTGSDSSLFEPSVISTVWLPNGKTYEFYYNEYGELARVVLPTGGATEYDWEAGIENLPLFQGRPASGVWWPNIYRRLVERRTYPNGATGANYESKTTYSKQEVYVGVDLPTDNRGYVTTTQFSPAGTVVANSKHYFFGYASFDPLSPLNTGMPLFFYTPWNFGREHKTELLSADGGTVLKSVTNTWEQRQDINWWTGNPDNAPPFDPRVTSTVTALMDVSPSQVTKQVYSYDNFTNRTAIDEFDYGANAPPALRTRRTEIDYITNLEPNGIDYTANNVHLKSLQREVRVYAINPSNGNKIEPAAATTRFKYDQFALTARAGIIQWQAPATSARGNLTSTERTLDNPAGIITTSRKYDVAGNVTEAIDGRNNNTLIDYSAASNAYAYISSVKSPVPDPSGVNGLTTRLETTYIYDFQSGLLTSTTDPNGQITTADYSNDPLDRLKTVTRPTGGGTTTYIYGDNPGNIFLRTQTTQSASQTLDATTILDGYARATKTSQLEGATTIFVDTEYDALGRAFRVSNPYRAGDTIQWTTTAYDILGRILSVTGPDGAATIYDHKNNTVKVTDPASKARTSIIDAYGRLTQVTEDPGTSPHLNYTTTYTYSVLDTLTGVTQPGQTARSFTYDSLSRLKTAFNPESGTMSYTYDPNSNLLTKLDARSITTTYTYDTLNRVKTRTYSGDPTNTPAVTYKYDGAGVTGGVLNSKGRLTLVTSSVSSYSYDEFDAMGRVKKSTQTTPAVGGTAYAMFYDYDLAGNMIWQKYPSGREVTTTYDVAGRISGVTGYASSIGYAAHGAMNQMTMGNGLVESASFNIRLQPTEIKLRQGTTDLMKLVYGYGAAATNNGNLMSQQIILPGMDVTQSYTYDNLNRLKDASERLTSNQQQQWQQSCDYDRYGNRWVTTSSLPVSIQTPRSINDYNPANNRITISGYAYDLAGNVKQNPTTGPNAFTYDAENRQVSYTNLGATTTYGYDGDGNRVKKEGGGVTTLFVYNALGQLIAEYANNVPTGALTRRYVTADHLGSTRLVTKQDQQVAARYDYLPLGETLGANVGPRTTGMGYSPQPDQLRQKFTAYERDNESGLDYAQARYYSSTQGRFTSPDPLLASGNPKLPQSWNRYAYSVNNPLVNVDPSGLLWYTKNGGDGHPEWFDDDPGDGYTRFTQYSYYAGEDKGYVALDQYSNNYQIGFDTLEEARSYSKVLADETLRALDPGQDVSLLEGALEMSMYISVVTGTVRVGIALTGELVAREATTTATEALAETATRATIHGAEQLAARGFTEADIALTKTGVQFLQRDGASVFLKEVAPGKYNVIVEGTRGVVTALKNISEKSAARLAQNYGWYSPLTK